MQYLDNVNGVAEVSSPGTSAVNRLRRTVDQAAPESNITSDSLAEEVERAIRHDTRGGVTDLEVRSSEDGVRLRGRCVSFYCKQLAQEAVMKLAHSVKLSNEIEVW